MKNSISKNCVLFLLVFIVVFGSHNVIASSGDLKSEVHYKSLDLKKLSKADSEFITGLKANSLLNFYYIELHGNIKKAVVHFTHGSKIKLHPGTIYQLPQDANHYTDISYDRVLSKIEQLQTSTKKLYGRDIYARAMFEADKLYQLRIKEKKKKLFPKFKRYDIFAFSSSSPLILEDGRKIVSQSSEVESLGRWPLIRNVKDCTNSSSLRTLADPFRTDINWSVCTDKPPVHSKGDGVRFARWEWVIKNLLHPEVTKKPAAPSRPIVTSPVPSQPIVTSFSSPVKNDTYTDPVIGMDFVWIKGGCYQMGQTETEKQYLIDERGKEKYEKYYLDELPRRKVCVDGFWMAKYEVTNEQYRQFKQNHNSKSYKGVDLNGAKQPAVYVSWNDAKEFIKWLNRKTGQEFFLPTEAQWEYAARAGTETIRYWGDNESDACKYANVHDLTSKGKFDNLIWKYHNCTDGYAGTAPVGSFKSNSFGLYDMLGNVWEWCEDVYDEKTYSKHATNNSLVTSGSKHRVIRGGGWNFSPATVRCADRGQGEDEPWFSDNDVGFRLCSPQFLQ